MGIKFNGREIGGMMYNGRAIESAMINGRLVWPEAMGREDTYLELTYYDTNKISYNISCPPDQQCFIHWGDGSTTIATGGVNKKYIHDYINIGDYIVTISGAVSGFKLLDGREMLRRPSTGSKFGSLMTSFYSCFEGCKNLWIIPDRLFDDCINATDFSYCFSNCSGVRWIDGSLFDDCVNATDFGDCFALCSFIESIPEKLFKNCVNATDFSGCFSECKWLKSIPSGLFDNCVNVTDFSHCFSECTQLRGNAPPLWKRENNPEGHACFLKCKYLSNYGSIPKDWRTMW